MTTTVADAGEHALIERIRARLVMPAFVLVGPGDDAAVVEPERGTVQVLTTDSVIEGVHFDRRFVAPEEVGHRALAVNLSDLAAMGAHPRVALLSLVLPPDLTLDDLDALLDGFLRLADAHKMTLAGGNITRSPGPLMIDVTATGSVRRRNVLRRAGARPGDAVYVTGRLGSAAAGLRLLQRGGAIPDDLASAVQAYLRPEPRVRAGTLLGRNRFATSCMDLSDGLADGVRQVAAASQVGILVDADALPIDGTVRAWCESAGEDPVRFALAGGDDYELLFTVRPGHAPRLRTLQHQLGDLPITRIGVVTKEGRVEVARGARTEPLAEGFEHFR